MFLAPFLLLAVAVAQEHALPSTHLTEEACAFLLSGRSAESEIVEIPGLSVLEPPAHQPEFVVDVEGGASLDGVICWRSHAEFGPDDDRVARTGVPFYIKAGSEVDQERTLVLEITPVGYRVRLVSGPELDPSEAQRVEARIESYNSRLGGGT